MKHEDTLQIMNEILEHELSGVVRYTHYSFMVFGYNRIPIVSWLRSQATESLSHAQQIGEHITTLGGHPSLKISPLLETHKHSIEDILKESLEHEQKTAHSVLQATQNCREQVDLGRGLYKKLDFRRGITYFRSAENAQKTQLIKSL